MKHHLRGLSVFIFFAVSACSSGNHKDSITLSEAEIQDIQANITATLHRQDKAWNRGDIDAFMEDYLKSEDLRFASGGNVNLGWQATIDGYKTRYPDKAAMGTLSFTDLEIDVFSASDAMVFGRWALEREKDRPNGLFTLHMHNQDGRWVIMSDHTSSAAP